MSSESYKSIIVGGSRRLEFVFTFPNPFPCLVSAEQRISEKSNKSVAKQQKGRTSSYWPAVGNNLVFFCVWFCCFESRFILLPWKLVSIFILNNIERNQNLQKRFSKCVEADSVSFLKSTLFYHCIIYNAPQIRSVSVVFSKRFSDDKNSIWSSFSKSALLSPLCLRTSFRSLRTGFIQKTLGDTMAVTQNGTLYTWGAGYRISFGERSGFELNRQLFPFWAFSAVSPTCNLLQNRRNNSMMTLRNVWKRFFNIGFSVSTLCFILLICLRGCVNDIVSEIGQKESIHKKRSKWFRMVSFAHCNFEFILFHFIRSPVNVSRENERNIRYEATRPVCGHGSNEALSKPKVFLLILMVSNGTTVLHTDFQRAEWEWNTNFFHTVGEMPFVWFNTSVVREDLSTIGISKRRIEIETEPSLLTSSNCVFDSVLCFSITRRVSTWSVQNASWTLNLLPFVRKSVCWFLSIQCSMDEILIEIRFVFERMIPNSESSFILTQNPFWNWHLHSS